MSQPANDVFSQHLSDDEASFHEDASKNERRSMIYGPWRMVHYLEYYGHDVWKEIQNGNSKKRNFNWNKDGVLIEYFHQYCCRKLCTVFEKERKARTILLMAIPKEHLRRFHGMDDAKEIWEAIRTRFGGNANSKKMQELISTSKSSASAQNVAFVSHSKSSTNKKMAKEAELKKQRFFIAGNGVGWQIRMETMQNRVNLAISLSQLICLDLKTESSIKNMEDRGIFDSGCSGHMTGNKDHLMILRMQRGARYLWKVAKDFYITGTSEVTNSAVLTLLSAKDDPRIHSTNSKARGVFAELQNLKNTEKEAYTIGISEDILKFSF
ncbi:hypothetical protein Tco_1385228 [Tanacetum coccineum]